MLDCLVDFTSLDCLQPTRCGRQSLYLSPALLVAGDMDRDSIAESPVKRQKTQSGYKSIGSGPHPHARSLSRPHATIPTQPLSHPPPTQPVGLVAGLLDTINNTSASSPYMTQPTQPLYNNNAPPRRMNASTPTVEVNRSSPPPAATPSPNAHSPLRQSVGQTTSGLKRPGFGSRLAGGIAPRGTALKLPPGIQSRPGYNAPIDLTDNEDEVPDPPIERSSDEETQPMRSTIKPTDFTKGGRNLLSSPNMVQETPRAANSGFQSIVASFAYDPSKSTSHAGMEGAYGNATRNKPVQAPRPRPQAVVPDITLHDILDYDVRKKVERMLSVYPSVRIRDLEEALRDAKGNYNDALESVSLREEEGVVDLTSSDIESGASKPAAKPVKMDNKPAAKQEVKAPTKTIQEKYMNAQKPKPESGGGGEHVQKKRRLVQANRSTPVSRTGSPSPQKPAASKKKVTVIDSDSEAEAVGSDDDEVEDVDFNARLLKFFNTCTAQDLADLSNEKLQVADFIISKRPFRNLDVINQVTDAQPTKSGKRSAKKAIGEKVQDVCREMLSGYEAVDSLVAQCDAIGKPIFEAMKQWGVDIASAMKDGELALTSLEDSLHDSGIGTPSSSLEDDDDVVRPKKAIKKSNFLKKPSIMSPDLVLKDYQLFGLNWLNLLFSKKLSCILADDMGLGKTCQVITFLAHLKQTGVEGPHLVVVPGSTLENWIREFGRFCPDNLVVSPYYGSQAEREEWRNDWSAGASDDIDVIVTTYETACGKMDAPFFRKTVRPVVAVFDEGHHLKNSTSKRHQELMRIPAEFRLLLTGTPLQNNLQELVSLLSFILPKLITPEKKEELNVIFKYKATTKDADHAALLSAQRIRRARSMMTPFILRRKKAQVLKHLPAKHRRVEYCDMPASQKDLYTEMVQEAIRMRSLPQPQKRGSAKIAQEMTALRFAALHPLLLRVKYTDKQLEKLKKTLLRTEEFGSNRPDQVWKYIKEDLKGGDYGMHKFCADPYRPECHPFMLQDEPWMEAGKVQKFKELLEAYVKNGDRVLVFSQFTTMMDILEAVLETLSIKFMRLDGSTNMQIRQDIIDKFTTDTSIPVFMLSTKAGGAGINLACANKVVIFDSSFNPQDDIQAENRAHRVGQTREVEVVRMVTRGTIEEQIHALGESKLALDERVAGASGESAASEKKAEVEGEQKVEEMFFQALEKKEKKAGDINDEEKGDGKDTTMSDGPAEGKDLKDEFKDGLREAGLDVKDD